MEIANAAFAVLQSAIALDRSELARLAARELGIARMGKKVQTAMDAGIDMLALQRRCEIKGDDVALKQEYI